MLQQEISIHAPRAGSDLLTSSALQARSNFNPRSPCGERPPASPTRFPAMDISIHAPRAGSDSAPLVWRQAGLLFQSTLPVRGATLTAFGRNVARDDFNPRSPCGERRLELHCGRGNIHFNPRSPCGERPDRNAIASKLLDFNPRSPCGERPHWGRLAMLQQEISIHAPRAGSDNIIREQKQLERISIHAPRAGSD